ncbi:phosphodiester glycosidase family protein [Streptomyces sp. C11-1]|uniref:Phosphodiester glycosidase family protein n=1 Tax=Streptomyces durocortorensis TaxID=2811104 RepID=A0ABY9W412_9ACTN|nr:phosphodiester glycosidase family protein [Streptomyces durocortorensis]WNF30224.1 phosphodiester glycosidase family protein [Streptomyces durocortorensis]
MNRRRLLAAGAAAWVLSGCRSPDGPAADDARGPSAGASRPPEPPRRPTVPLPPGVTYAERTVRMSGGPVRHQVLTIARSAPVRVSPVHGDRLDSARTVRSMARDAGAVAAVNGSFFDIRTSAVFSGYDGDPLGLLMENGTLLSEAANGRTALVLGVRGAGPRIVEARSVTRVTAADGTSRPVDGVNRVPGRIVGCGGTGGDVLRRTGRAMTRPVHNQLCTDSGELVLFTPHWGPATAAGGDEVVEAVLAADGRVLDLRRSAGPVPAHGRVLQGIGEGAAWLRRHAAGSAVLTLASEVFDETGRRIPGEGAGMLGAGPRLLRGGATDINIEANGVAATALRQRHPRTLAGVAEDGTLLLVTVDGREPGGSVGATFDEAAELMRSLGAHDAMNLDGGGSTTMIVNGRLRNRPRSGEGAEVGERAVADALVVVPL